MASDFAIVTEHGGELVSRAQVERFRQRYIWAGGFCEGRDVLEMACGTGPGLGYLKSRCKSLIAGDLSPSVLDIARAHYRDRIQLLQFDATRTPFEDGLFDVVILFEAIYYLPDVEAFAGEVRRLLKVGGTLLLATANKSLPDFNPSPFSKRYLDPPELGQLLERAGFRTRFFGGSPVQAQALHASVLRMVKRFAVAFRLIPRSMRGKRFLKRLVFGRLVRMPAELLDDSEYIPPQSIDGSSRDTRHQVLYCIAEKIN